MDKVFAGLEYQSILHKYAQESNRTRVEVRSDDVMAIGGAIADYTRALQFISDDAAIYYGRGSARQKKKDLDGALADYTKAIQIDPKHALAYANRAVVKTLQHKPDATTDFETALRLDPSLRASYQEFYEKRRKP